MSHFIAYAVTPDMGLRESINAMLLHCAYGQSMGYDAHPIHASNLQGLLEDYGHLIEPAYILHCDTARLVPKVTDSEGLADLVEILVGLCNDYPVYDEDRMSQVERAQLVDYLSYCTSEGDPEPETIAYALYELSLNTRDTDGSPYVKDSDYSAAVEYAREHLTTV